MGQEHRESPIAGRFALAAALVSALIPACGDETRGAGQDPSSGGRGGASAGAAGAAGTAGAGAAGGSGAGGVPGGNGGAAGTGPGGAGGTNGASGTGGAGGGGTSGAAGTAGGGGTSGAAGTAGGSGTAGAAGTGGRGGTSGSGGSGGTAGSAGTGGSSGCPAQLIGWATVSGDGVSTTTGGGNAAPVRPSNASELLAYASDATPRVIEIAGTFNAPRLQVNSNKTLIGIGSNATINGGVRIRGSSDAPVQNVIVRNLRVNGATTDVDNDAMQIYFAHHVWIDHCDIWDGPDGNLDMTHAVNWVTVSWTKFRYTAAYVRPSGETSDHRFSSLIGHSDDNAGEDSGRLKITFHHNWWADRVIERMPRVRFGQVHVFNNYYSSVDNNYCVRAGRGAQLLVEGNYFNGVNGPHEFNSAADEATAHITARNNGYSNVANSDSARGGGTPFTSAPYAATVRPALDVPAIVQACTGPRP
jgi:pectate lyase